MSWEYDLPEGFEDWDEERKNQYYEEERSLMQAKRQYDGDFEGKLESWLETIKKQSARIKRRMEANPAWVDLEDYR